MASISGTKYNAKHFSSSNDYQIQQQNWFEITVEGFPDFTYLCIATNLPEPTNEEVEVPHGNSSAYQAGKRTYSPCTLTFLDAIKKDIEAQFLQWQAQVYSTKDGAMGWIEEYKKTVYITEYGPNGSARRKWTLYGAWPTDVAYGDLSGEGSGRKDIRVTLRFDDFDRYKQTAASNLNNTSHLL